MSAPQAERGQVEEGINPAVRGAMVLFFLPAAVALVLGVALFNRVDQAGFRRIIFAVLFVSGVVLLVRG